MKTRHAYLITNTGRGSKLAGSLEMALRIAAHHCNTDVPDLRLIASDREHAEKPTRKNLGDALNRLGSASLGPVVSSSKSRLVRVEKLRIW